jgi:hypothetical protein
MDKIKLLDGLKKIKEAFLAAKFVDAKLNDGTTVIRYDGDKLDIGVQVLAVTEQGAIAMPDGDYTLEDGTMFTVVNGVVSSVMAGVNEEEAELNAAPAPAAAMTEATAKSIIESVIRESHFVTEQYLTEKLQDIAKEKEFFSTQKNETDKLIFDLNSEIQSQKETIKQMFSLIEILSGEPSSQPAEQKGKPFDVKNFRKEFKADLAKVKI